MPSPQQPLGSGFGRDSTPSDILGDLDLGGTYALVTGGASGLGLETSRALAAAGADVLVLARRPERAAEALATLDEALPGAVRVAEIDLADLGSVGRLAEALVDAARPVDVLINNAGIMATPETRVGPGWEAQFATNHLGHFALVGGIWPLIAAGGGRVVSLSSTAHKVSPIRWDDMMFESGYDKWTAYGQSKTANALFALHLDTLGEPHGVRAFSVHPGGIMTELQRHLPNQEMVDRGWIGADGTVNPLFKTPEQGAATSVWAATSAQLDGMGGVYCEDCDVAAPTDPESPYGRFLGVDRHATDRDEAARLWSVSVGLTGVDALA